VKKHFSTKGVDLETASHRILSTEDKKKRAGRIAELKKTTKCNKCGQRGHWTNDMQCPDNKGRRTEKGGLADKNVDPKNEANATINDDLDSMAFMAHTGTNQVLDNA